MLRNKKGKKPKRNFSTHNTHNEGKRLENFFVLFSEICDIYIRRVAFKLLSSVSACNVTHRAHGLTERKQAFVKLKKMCRVAVPPRSFFLSKHASAFVVTFLTGCVISHSFKTEREAYPAAKRKSNKLQVKTKHRLTSVPVLNGDTRIKR